METENLNARIPHYYEALGMGIDAILRCTQCQRLQTQAELAKRTTCVCGNKRMNDVKTLSAWEWLKIRTGWINFPHRKLFLKEFAR